MRLLAVEVRRFWARRAIVVVLLLTLAGGVLLAGTTIWSTRGASQAETSDAQQQLAVETEAMSDDYRECLADPPAQPADEPAAERCEDLDPQLDWFLPREQLDLRDQLGGTGLALSLILTGAAIVVGTTFAGADWSSGALSTQLLYRPRRVRLWLAKATAVVLGTAVTALAVTAGYWLALGLVAQARGLPVDAALVGDLALQSARTSTLAAAAALGAFALTMALRSTMATLSLLFLYTVAGEALWASVPIDRSSRWSLAVNLQAWVLDGLRVSDETICAAGETCQPSYVLSAAHGGTYLAVLVVVAVLVSVVTFRRRDVR